MDDELRPKVNDMYIYLPVTLNYSAGRASSNKSKWLWVGIVSVVGIIITLGTLFSKDGNIISNLLLAGLIFLGVLILVRFGMLKEHKIRDNMVSLVDDDYKKSYNDLWGIYQIDNDYPYYCHMRNGLTAVFIEFEKDVIVGKPEDFEYEHYEAIADAYNIAGSEKIGMCHIDYMGNVGSDDRLVDCFRSLGNISNPDLKEFMTDIYVNLRDIMEDKVTTYDVYCFTFKSSETVFWYNIQRIIACMLEANYIRYKVLNQADIRSLSIELFNLEDFSINDANLEAFTKTSDMGITPIMLYKADGSVTKLGKTKEELAMERELQEKAKAEGINSKDKELDIDLFN